MTIKIVGAGLAGLLAGNMLARHRPLILEKQPSLPNNHSAVLRFRTPTVGDVIGVPFAPVTMVKATLPWKNPVADALSYSYKTNGTRRSDRSVVAGLVTGTRYIAPPDLVARMAAPLSISYNLPAAFAGSVAPYISTLPMPTLMELLDYPGRRAVEFKWRNGVNIKAKVDDCDAYVSLMVPDPHYPFSRISLTGDELIIECHGMPALNDVKEIVHQACDLLGIDWLEVSAAAAFPAQYAKIVPIDDDIRRDFIHWASAERNVFSLGRFATWRPGLLLDDLVNDIRLIEGWINRPNRYALAKAR